MISILSRTISSILDKKVVIENGQMGALIDIGDDWNELWLGCRLALTDANQNLTGSPNLCIGVLSNPASGMTNGPLTSSTSHFVGQYAAAFSFTASRNAGPPVTYNYTWSTGKRVGNTITSAGGSTGIISGDPTIRFALIVQILKGSPNFTLGEVYPSAADTDIPLDVLINAMEASSTSSARDALNAFDASGYTLRSNPCAVDEATDGALNAVCLAWNRTIALAEISELLFVKKS